MSASKDESAPKRAPDTADDAVGGSSISLPEEIDEAFRRGLSLLARAEQSTRMMKQKLAGRGYSAPAISAALERLTADGFLDDNRYATAYAASRLSRRAEGPSSLAAALRSRGLDAGTVRETVAAALGKEGEEAVDGRRAALEKAAAREIRRSGGDMAKVRLRLRKLGYGYKEIDTVLSA